MAAAVVAVVVRTRHIPSTRGPRLPASVAAAPAASSQLPPWETYTQKSTMLLLEGSLLLPSCVGVGPVSGQQQATAGRGTSEDVSRRLMPAPQLLPWLAECFDGVATRFVAPRHRGLHRRRD